MALNRLKFFLEGQLFGVCSLIGEQLGISPNIIRLYFIYLTFIASPSPIILYLMIAFWISLKNYLHWPKNPVWE